MNLLSDRCCLAAMLAGLVILAGCGDEKTQRRGRTGTTKTTTEKTEKTDGGQTPKTVTEGWGGRQAMAGPVLVIPDRATATETVVENGQSVTRSRDVLRELTLAPETIEMTTDVRPELRNHAGLVIGRIEPAAGRPTLRQRS